MTEVAEEQQLTYRIQINYKSGNSVECWFDAFNVKHSNGEITSISWKETDSQKQFLFLGMNSVESVVQLEFKVKE